MSEQGKYRISNQLHARLHNFKPFNFDKKTNTRVMLLWLKSLVWGSAPKTRWELVRHLLGPWYGRELYQGPPQDIERVQLNQLRCQQVRQERYSTLGLSKGPQQIAQQSMNFDMANSTWSTERGTQPGATLGGTSEVQKLPLWPPGSWENTHVAADAAEPNPPKHGNKKSMSSQDQHMEPPYLTVLSSCQKRHNDICRKMRTLANLQTTNLVL